MKGKKLNMLLVICFLMVLLVNVPVYADSLDNAKEIIDDYYLYSKEKNVEEYTKLFDEYYLNEIYGEYHEDLFEEIFTYFDIDDYEIEYQYYTEGEDSLSLFFNLKSNMVIEGSKKEIDNDLVGFFSKKDGKLKLRYIILQETFIEQMNREFVYTTAVESLVEENSDLLKEAEEKGIKVVDYKKDFEDMINKHRSKNIFNSILFVFGAIIVLLTLAVLFKGKIKNKHIVEYINRVEEVSKKAMHLIKEEYEYSKPVCIEKYRKTKQFTKEKYKQISQQINEFIDKHKKR
jgi:hypothetical protein